MRTLLILCTFTLAITLANPARAEVRTGVEKATGSSSIEACTVAEEKAHDQINSPTITIPYEVSSAKVEKCECGQSADTEWTCSVEWGMSLERR